MNLKKSINFFTKKVLIYLSTYLLNYLTTYLLIITDDITDDKTYPNRLILT